MGLVDDEVEPGVERQYDDNDEPSRDEVDEQPHRVRDEPAPRADVAVAHDGEPDGRPEGGEEPGGEPDGEGVVLHPGGVVLVVGEDEVGVHGDGEDPVIGWGKGGQ